MFRFGVFLAAAVVSCISTPTRADEAPRPLVVAHRGLLLHAPENTLANFRACLELRLGFEFDVQRTKDGVLVCIHDDTLDRTTNGTGQVSEASWADIQKLDAGSWFDPKFTGEKVPTIEKVMKLIAEYRQHEILLAVDLKAEGVEADVVRLAEMHQVLHRLIFIGRTINDPKVREQIKKASLDAQTAAVANTPDEFSAALTTPHTDWVYLRFIPSKEQIEAVHRARKRAFLAGPTVSGNTPDNWTKAMEAGSDAILTDDSLELGAVIRRKSR